MKYFILMNRDLALILNWVMVGLKGAKEAELKFI
jgi:hypothetical protein